MSLVDVSYRTDKVHSRLHHTKIKENNIVKCLKILQDYVTDNIPKDSKHNTNDYKPIAESEQMIQALYETIHDENFLVQQNRDLYREIYNYACSGLRQNWEYSDNIAMAWLQTLDNTLDDWNFEERGGVNMTLFGDLIQQLILQIQSHDKCDKQRKRATDFRKFQRRIVTAAISKKKTDTDSAWNIYRGSGEMEVSRNARLAEIQENFYKEKKYASIVNRFNRARDNDGYGKIHESGETPPVYGAREGLHEEGRTSGSGSWADEMEDSEENSALSTPNESDVNEYIRIKLASFNVSMHSHELVEKVLKSLTKHTIELIEQNSEIYISRFLSECYNDLKIFLDKIFPEKEKERLIKVRVYNMLSKYRSANLIPRNRTILEDVKKNYKHVLHQIRQSIIQDMPSSNNALSTHQVLPSHGLSTVCLNPYII